MLKDIDSLEIMRLVGNTPLYRLDCETGGAELWIKLEGGNPGGSIKDRAAWGMLREAQKRGELTERSVIVEPTSGNTGIGLAALCAVRGYRLVIVMPDTMSVERRKLMAAYGAELVLTPGALGMSGAVAEAERLAAERGRPDEEVVLQLVKVNEVCRQHLAHDRVAVNDDGLLILGQHRLLLICREIHLDATRVFNLLVTLVERTEVGEAQVDHPGGRRAFNR